MGVHPQTAYAWVREDRRPVPFRRLPLGTILAVTIEFNPAGVTVTAEMQGHAPLRLVAADGRISQFPRGWATVTTADGRRGVGWLEWNRNQLLQ